MTDAQARVFGAARDILAANVPPLVVLKDEPEDYQVTAGKPVVLDKRKMDSVWFAGLKLTKSDVTLHFLPVYCDPTLVAMLDPVFTKTLKGKACFHLGAFGPELQAATRAAMEVGLEAYRRRGWI